ncbi:MAG TPA: hypothetical protein VF786_10910 [Terriglobales bacterium]
MCACKLALTDSHGAWALVAITAPQVLWWHTLGAAGFPTALRAVLVGVSRD